MRSIVFIARILSTLFRPTSYPLVGFVILFTLSHMNVVPWQYKVRVLLVVYLFTMALPALGVHLYRRTRGLTLQQLRIRRWRAWPYIINLVNYLCCLRVMQVMRIPHFMGGIIVASLMIQCACLLLNTRWKVSMHSAGAGGIAGALVAYASIFTFNPVWWLCGALIVDGLVMSSRMVLRQHTLGQVVGGSLIGAACSYLGIIFT